MRLSNYKKMSFSKSLAIIFPSILLLIGYALIIPRTVMASVAPGGEAAATEIYRWQTPSVLQTQINSLSTETISGEGQNSAFLSWSMSNLAGYMIGFIPDGGGRVQGAQAGGAVGSFGNLIAGMTSTPPVHTATYIADLGQSLGLAKPAYAQGTGFRALEPVLPIWKAFRNIAYFGFVIIFVVIGFMIMFRKNIDPQTVITVQSSLPKIIITLLLITFSYAIASLMIDLIYFLIYLIVGLFKNAGLLGGGFEATKNELLERTLLGIAFQDLLGPGPGGAAGAATATVNELIKDILGTIGGAVANMIAGPLAYVIFAVAILIAVFKLFFQLLMAYIGIIFSVIFAPIMLLFNALPGSNSFGSWLKGILANVLVFPVTALMFLIAAVLLGQGKLGTNPNLGYGAYDYAKTQLPFIGTGISPDALMALIAIGFLMMMPKVIEMIQKMMGIEGGIMGMMGGAMEGIKTPFSPLVGFGSQVAGGYASSLGSQYAAKGIVSPIRGAGRNIKAAWLRRGRRIRDSERPGTSKTIKSDRSVSDLEEPKISSG